MASKQTFKGILQFKNQDALKNAMDLVLSEAAESDLIDLQDSFLAEGLMLFNMNISAPAETWEENHDAMLILAENASRGFIVAVFNGGDPEFFQAGGDDNVAVTNAPEVPASEDYFPFVEGKKLTYRGLFGEKKTKVTMTTGKLSANGRDFYFLADSGANLPGFNDYWDGTYFLKDGGNIFAVHATHEAGLKTLDFDNDNYAAQLVYSNIAKPGQTFANIASDNENFRILTVEGFETLDLPAGKFENCMCVRISRFQINAGDTMKTSMKQYFAKGVGLVKVQFEKGSVELESAE